MLNKLCLAALAIKELGFQQIWQFVLYQAGLRSGYYRLRTPSRPLPPDRTPMLKLDLLPLPDPIELRRITESQIIQIISRADEVAEGKVRLFGGEPVNLELVPPGANKHWTRAKVSKGDIKQIWEPARFGWIFDLGRAYLLNGDERYPAVFWQFWEEFQNGNRYNKGPNWSSAQEVALRLISLCFAARLFWNSIHSTVERKARLTASLVDHARRIPVTLSYARAQNNNHLVSEAAGLYMAGLLLSDFPEAGEWKTHGWDLLNQAFQTQIEEDGEYSQHSSNYHRLIMQLALLVDSLTRQSGEFLPSTTTERLAAAIRWLLAYFDSQSGRAANLGHNDGANVLPMSFTDQADYRPIIQAASLAFLGRQALPAGSWDEYPLWLGLNKGLFSPINSGANWRIDQAEEWASLRARNYKSRPAHADQLQVELWYRGHYILLDPGTYSYNNPPPWNNGLAACAVHNGLTIDNQEPMQRAGKFLWLDWARAGQLSEESASNTRLSAYHDGYLRRGVRCKRILEWLNPGEWKITDQILYIETNKNAAHQAALIFLLPDGAFDFEENLLKLTFGDLRVTVTIEWPAKGVSAAWTRLVRAGKILAGPAGDVDRFGWYSPTYSVLIPAISFQINLACQKPIEIQTMIHIESI